MKSPAIPHLPPGVSRWQLRFVLLGGGSAWLLHLVLSWATVEFGVLSGFAERRWAGLGAVTWLVLGLGVAMAALAAAAAFAAWRLREKSPSIGETQRALAFCAKFGLLTNLAFLVIIAVQTIPVFFFLRP